MVWDEFQAAGGENIIKLLVNKWRRRIPAMSWEDLYQEARVSAYEATQSWDGRSKLVSWCWNNVNWKLANLCKHHNSRRQWNMDPGYDVANAPARPSDRSDQVLEWVDAALGCCTSRQRTAWRAYVRLGGDERQVAREMRCSRQYVHVCVKRVRDVLRREWERRNG